ncbi:UvrD-helicase domain-containing protein [Leptospira sp. GIMC2001]|uniref:UvrD-helicase domain-containing protein n=1 Tax=Leptospira sp. GIMC2001 TaxID=1513297 RepID=UPI00234BBC4B|nr:UvrD-helicase domain-containing protein [Leptospira sp. GIMC2001]WCL50756.1 UvrD-helicase domain-containing protein [Leptospira sp. GIMC2001]
MNFYIAESFTASLKRLSNAEQKQAKTSVFDLQTDPAHPSLKFHRIDKSKDPNFWSIRINSDLRCVLHKKEDAILVCYIDHHDKAYAWAEKRKIEVHPSTGAVQIVVVPEIEFPIHPSSTETVQSITSKRKPFRKFSEEKILNCGVPEGWVTRIQEADEDSIFDILEVLPAEAGEALLNILSGKKPTQLSEPLKDSKEGEGKNPFQHPDSKRRFHLITGQSDLEEALQASWAKWTIYLHPLQRNLVEKNYNGPVRISGSAGTGKSIVALHRAYYLAKYYPEDRILLTSFSELLVDNLRQNFHRLIISSPQIAERVEVSTLEKLAIRLYKSRFSEPNIIEPNELRNLAQSILIKQTFAIPKSIILGEFLQVIDAWNIEDWNTYKEFKRIGRRARLSDKQRQEVWDYAIQVRTQIKSKNQLTHSQMYYNLALQMEGEDHSVFNTVVLDEAQDITPSMMKFISSLSKDSSKFFFTGDLGQRIFQIPFSWNSFGMDIRGRSFTLRVNYRTSQQIRLAADKLLEKEIRDFDGNVEKRTDTISLFQGPAPETKLYPTPEEETSANAKWLQEILDSGISSQEILIIIRSENEYPRALSLSQAIKIPFTSIDSTKKNPHEIATCTMNEAKGLEFRVVLIIACDSHVIPQSSRIKEASEEAELEEIYETERHLLYVASTRARDILRITGTKPGSEFLSDFR